MYKIFVDLDGVLVDFDAGVQKHTGKLPEALEARTMWSILARSKDFYDSLPWTKDGKLLWNTLLPLSPTVLTGLPRGEWARPQKLSWCARELGPEVPVLTCLSKEKAKVARGVTSPSLIPVLIDDRISLKESWEAMGGLFIHHATTNQSLKLLYEAKVLIL